MSKKYQCSVVLSEPTLEECQQLVEHTVAGLAEWQYMGADRYGHSFVIRHTNRKQLSKLVQELDYWDVWNVYDIYNHRVMPV